MSLLLTLLGRIKSLSTDITPIERVLGRKPSVGILRVFGCDAYAYDHGHLKQVVPYAKKLRHIGVSPDSKGWLLWCEETGKVVTAASVQFDEAPIIHAAYSLHGLLDGEAVVSAIGCEDIEDFKLGDALDEQDVAVAVLESRDPYGSDSPSYEEAMKSPEAEEWKEAMSEEMKLLEHHEVHEEADPPKDKK
ncbi:uncharacterized protein VP01_5690g2 [Puccinia sorghi]|uniref:Retroviral polymerase SH3-like domain-containing protein n=1 Tax=Puccinia sorghi TaxID=27349 RepID=A0A0L6UIQ5_9BASI|nr:uncharacterized protein VP01_5690g2 [Puccinia sorghi]